ncbi:MAG: D-alanine--D-alanine ligase [Coriobacteriia bacterium]|nr:D-alanine--D-alanine ligase [Coriobacteriia bacterium]
MSKQALRIAVLMGGRSAEREVSLHTGEQVAGALASVGHDVVPVDTADIGFIEALRVGGFDVAFICLHGRFGEDGTIQGLLELIELPYVGSGVLASALAMDKVVSKQIFVAAGIPTPEWIVVRRGCPYSVADISARLGEKLVVKPVNEGSSVGMSIVHDPDELGPAIECAFEHDHTVLIEEFVTGAEVTVGVLGNSDLMALPTLEVVPEHEFYDYDSKYLPGMSRHIIPARVSDAIREECQRIAIEAHCALACRGMSRADTIVTGDGIAYLLEVNTIPGMTKTSLLPDAARAAGIEFPQLCDRLVSLALEC